ncbi:WD40 repeat-containing protein [Filobasidium floriforme]|uniref:WD40 repeat-containing protein n=1 Tax=Filobasidium floriforme TaxID=5210 RepID=UPI001E8E22AF|nr:WD40 repeat-containing protein [Filobasidium floriforme]KAH8088226.1 WD40 repeat-containing protein [Filobasidium floriforme]
MTIAMQLDQNIPSQQRRRAPRYRKHRTLISHLKGVTCLKYSPCGRYLASADSGEHVRSYRGHDRGINDLVFSPDCLYLATAGDEGLVLIWSIKQGTILRTLLSHTSHVLCITFNPKGNVLVTGGWDESVIFWNVRSGEKMRTLQAHSDPVTAVGYNVDGTVMVTGSYDGLMRIWDGSTGQCLKTIENEENSPCSYAAFTPNGDNLISCSLSSCIRIWNYHTSRCIKTYTGHTNVKYSSPALVIDPTAGIDAESENRQTMDQERIPDAWILSGSDTSEVCIWDGQSKELLQRLEGHTDTVIALAVHPFKRMIATGGLERDKTIILWRDEE